MISRLWHTRVLNIPPITCFSTFDKSDFLLPDLSCHDLSMTSHRAVSTASLLDSSQPKPSALAIDFVSRLPSN